MCVEASFKYLDELVKLRGLASIKSFTNNYTSWIRLCQYYKLPLEFIQKYYDNLDIKILLGSCKYSEDVLSWLIEKNVKNLVYCLDCKQSIPIDILSKLNFDSLDNDYLYQLCELDIPINLFVQLAESLGWLGVFDNCNLSMQRIISVFDYISVEDIEENYALYLNSLFDYASFAETDLTAFVSMLYTKLLPKLEDFADLEDFQQHLWYKLLVTQIVSEAFLTSNMSRSPAVLKYAVRYQNVSLNFIFKYKDMVKIEDLQYNIKLDNTSFVKASLLLT